VTNLDESVLEIARDAIREGRSHDIAGIIADTAKTSLVGEALATLAALGQSAGISYFSLHLHGSKPSASIQCESVDDLVEDFRASGARILAEPNVCEHNGSTWRSITVAIGGIEVSCMSHSRSLTPAEKRKATIARRKAIREATTTAEVEALGATVIGDPK
jgi:hypothetical protein